MSNKRRIVFISGTRADYGKIKPLLKTLHQDSRYNVSIIVTGMHLLSKYGTTIQEIEKDGLGNLVVIRNQDDEQPMEITLSRTISELSEFMQENPIDLLVVHGDRIEALAGAIVGSIRNVPVAHIEGGEVSGTIDGLIRHSVSKLSHLHFVANSEARKRILQLGESANTVHVIGSPDVDIMLGADIPDINDVQARYSIPFSEYGILIFHPVTTEVNNLHFQIQEVVKAIQESNKNFVVIKPNNDQGSDVIQEALLSLDDASRFVHIPSMRFEYFLGLLKCAEFIIGNSSAGVREAPYFGLPAINIGSRQASRVLNPLVKNVQPEKFAILEAIKESYNLDRKVYQQFGNGNSATLFADVLNQKDFWPVDITKLFVDQAPPHVQDKN
jgi:UDP-N-acetylglucosamine 2-epimerase (hydrolysing)